MDDSSSTHLFFNPYPVCRSSSSTVGTNLVFTSSNITTGNHQGLRTTTMSIRNDRRIPLPPPSSLPFFTSSEELMFDDEYYYDEQLPEKKRRLSPDQVNMLEKSFEAENKLETERKTELAKKLGLQPRQVAVWFQNRRARWKTKQLERDYDLLKNSYDSLLINYDSILKENNQLKSQVLRLTDKLQALPPDEESPTSATNKDADNHDVGLLYAASVASVHQLCTKPEEGLSSGTGSSTATATATGVTGGSGGVNMQQLVDSTGDSYFHSDEDYYPPPPMLGLGVGVTHLTDDAIPSEEDDDTGNNCREDLLLLQWFHGTTCQQEYYS